MNFLREAQNGVPVAQICRTHGISNATFYSWRSKYGGMDKEGAFLSTTGVLISAENAGVYFF
jgi:transposase-like protein